ncbi:AlpA family transcriptional regulator [Acidovorax temperans]|uniref:helix-turn-helix transcriptional regulator n=1 Tax=Acidovorax temperans TaxID=80878 RepID=UPI0030CCE7CB
MRILRLPAVSELTGLPRSTLYLYISKGQFPKPVKLGIRSVGWIQEEVDQWLLQKKESRLF